MKDRLEDKISIEQALKIQEEINNDFIKLESVRYQMNRLQEQLEKRAEELGGLEKKLINKEIILKNKEKELLKKEVIFSEINEEDLDIERFRKNLDKHQQGPLKSETEDIRKAYEGPEEEQSPGEEFLAKYRLDKNKRSDQKSACEKSDRLGGFCTSRSLSPSYGQLPSVVYKPRVFVDGNMWCALWGENLMEGVAGFGKSPAEAVNDFDRNWFKAIL